MCGIAGIIGEVGDANRAALGRMMDAIAHRGPDGHGVWESPPDSRGFGALLGHRRLAILDLSPAGAQPMTDPVTGQVLVFNGEIYNYQSLRSSLTAAGQQFQSTGDSQVMLRALGLEGPAAIARLRGMFAFALWDPAQRTLLLARDPLGIKPLYLARNRDPSGKWTLAFASEVRALLASGLLGAPRLEPAAMASLVWNGFVVGPQTAVSGVESLPPGHWLLLDPAGQITAKEHWSASRHGQGQPIAEEELVALLEETVRLHLISDVPLSVFLSSGVDSSVVANLARHAQKGPVHTFTLAFEDAQLNEAPAARSIAAAIGTEHREVMLTEDRFVAELERALDSLDQPSFDGLNSYYMARAVREAGFTVALVGTGGDELFGGYASFRRLPRLRRWSRSFGWVPLRWRVAAARAAARALQPGSGRGPELQTRWAKLPALVAQGGDLSSLYQLAYALFLPDFQAELLDGMERPLKDGLPDAMHARLLRETRGRSPLSTISVMEERIFLGERLLRDNDAVSMASSIEQRLPLVDQVLFEAIDRLPDDVRYAPLGKKALLRRIGLRSLDPALFDRPKSGFVLPYDRWIRKGLGKAIDETLRDPQAVRAAGLAPEAVLRLWSAFRDGGAIYWSRIWALFVAVRWTQRHRVFR